MRADEVFAAFAAAWNTADDAERLRLLKACCRPGAVFAAPQGQITGIDGLGASIGEFRAAFPAAQVAFGVPDGYGGFARVSWVTRWRDGRPDLAGEDFARLAVDGRIELLVSFDGTAAEPGQLYPVTPATSRLASTRRQPPRPNNGYARRRHHAEHCDAPDRAVGAHLDRLRRSR